MFQLYAAFGNSTSICNDDDKPIHNIRMQEYFIDENDIADTVEEENNWLSITPTKKSRRMSMLVSAVLLVRHAIHNHTHTYHHIYIPHIT